KVLGLNHLTWFYGFEVNGQNLWPQIMPGILAEAGDPEEIPFDRDTLQSLQMLPNYYLKYYYYTKDMLAEQEKWPPSRAEEVLQIEADLLAQYRDPERTDPPDDLMKRGGAYYSTVATQLLNAHYNDLDEVHVVDVRHNGAVAGWDPDWVLELPCRVNAHGIQPLSAEPLPPVCSGLIAQVKAYEILTAQAAVTGDRNAAYQALLAHPLGPAADQVSAVLDDLLETNKAYLPAFFK
ncbi:MAG: 6-phospho-beta-glucosidase, partial [Anaerolineaceae bacterium]|nr:6-phospho-beta-glucosidase [Anaerolineaceae bacterium]